MNDTPNVLGLIPARGGSKGLPRKNLRSLGGKPLIAYSIEVAKRCPAINEVVVTTEDEEIARVAKQFGAEVPFLRDCNLSRDETPMEPVVQDAILRLEALRGKTIDIIVLLVPTNPFRTASDIEAGVRILLETGADSVVSLVEDDYPISWLQTIVNGKVVPFLKQEREIFRRQDAPEVYRRNDGFFTFSRRTIMELATVQGPDTRPYVMDPIFSVDIDNMWDFELAELLLPKVISKIS